MTLKDVKFLFNYKNELTKIDTKWRFRKKYYIMEFDICRDDFESEFKLSDTYTGHIYRGYSSLVLDDGTSINANRSVYLEIKSTHAEFHEEKGNKTSKVIYTISVFVTY